MYTLISLLLHEKSSDIGCTVQLELFDASDDVIYWIQFNFERLGIVESYDVFMSEFATIN